MKTIVILLVIFLLIIGFLKLLDKARPSKTDGDGKPKTRTGFKIIGAILLIFFAVVIGFAFLRPGKKKEENQVTTSDDGGWRPDAFAQGGTFKIGETWEISGMWKMTVNSVKEYDERSQFIEKNPAAVYVVNYTIENIGYERNGDSGLYLPMDTYIKDSSDRNGYSYPVPISDDLMARPTYKGAKNQIEVGIGVETAGTFKIGVKTADPNGNLQSALFIIEP